MSKLKLNQCKCGKTYSLNEVNATEKLCSVCNEKILDAARKKDALRKATNRESAGFCKNLEKLGGIDD